MPLCATHVNAAFLDDIIAFIIEDYLLLCALKNFKSAVGVKTSGDLILVAECKESNHIFPDVRPCALKSQRTQLIHSLSLHCKI